MNEQAAVYVRVSTDEQRDNGYSIDSQIRMIKEYCEKNNYVIVGIYNDAGYSGKDLMRPAMQKLLQDIKTKKIDKLLAIKVDRLTRNNYDGFWLLNYCEQHDVKIELILEPYDVSTANGEMIYGMNLVFGQRERKEIGARTKRALEEMALEKVHPNKAPYGYIRDKDTGHLLIESIEAQVVKEIFKLCKKGHSTRDIAKIMKEDNAYLKQGKWTSGRIHKILTNSIYIGTFAFGKYQRKQKDILYVNDYCESIIDQKLWNITRVCLEKNKHSNYGEHIHLFTALVKCPECKNILSSTISYKYNNLNERIEYYHLTCKNANCNKKGIHYSSNKIEKQLKLILNELIKYTYENPYEIKTSTYQNNEELKNTKVDLVKCLTNNHSSPNFNWDTLDRQTKKEIINKYISEMEITRNKKYDIEIINIKFIDEFISNNNNDYLKNLMKGINKNEKNK